MSDANQITLNYTGGSFTTTIGVARALFGEDNDVLDQEPEAITSRVRSHPRVRVIGGPSVQVPEHGRDYMQWPTSQANNAGAGTPVYLTWQDSDGSWTGRVTGRISSFATFLSTNTTVACVFRTARGTKYGPFNGTITE